jgi:hypothetical protein
MSEYTAPGQVSVNPRTTTGAPALAESLACTASALFSLNRVSLGPALAAAQRTAALRPEDTITEPVYTEPSAIPGDLATTEHAPSGTLESPVFDEPVNVPAVAAPAPVQPSTVVAPAPVAPVAYDVPPVTGNASQALLQEISFLDE